MTMTGLTDRKIIALSHLILNSSESHTERYLAMTGLYMAGIETPGWIYEIDVISYVLTGKDFSPESKELAAILGSQKDVTDNLAAAEVEQVFAEN